MKKVIVFLGVLFVLQAVSLFFHSMIMSGLPRFYWPSIFAMYMAAKPAVIIVTFILLFIALLSSIKPEHYYDVDMLESIKKDKPIKTGDCISPNRGQWMTDEEFGLSESHRKERNKIKVNDSDYADVRAMATKVHADKYETVIKR